MKVNFYADQSAIRSLSLPNGIVGSAVRNAGETTVTRVKAAITAAGRVKSGDMRRGIKRGALVVTRSSVTQQVTGTEPYTRFQDRGTRTGIKPARFFETGLRQLRPSDFRPN